MVDYTPRILAGRYEVGDLIGRGGMAEVHVGRDTRLGRTVAIKVLRSELARDPAFQTRFRREAQAAASLNHPAIVAVYDTGEDISTDPTGATVRVPYIIMEYVEGHTLRELMRDGAALPIDEAIDITVGVLSALQYAHHSGIVHRDIKPANIMLTAAGQVKVMDFGIARALADTAATMTQTQAVIGTAQYLSPEQARGETVDARSDLYSTGCVLYELLTGRPPFIGDSAVAVAYQHVRERPVAPSTLAPDVPEVLDRIVLKALAKERDLRYSTASEFRGDLEMAKRGGVVPAPAVLPVTPPSTATQVMTPPTYPATPTPPPVIPPSPPTTRAEPGLFPTGPAEEDETDDDEASAKRNRWLLIGLISVVAIIAIAVIVFLATRTGGDGADLPSSPPTSQSPSETASTVPLLTTVPPVSPGTTYDQALLALKALDLQGVRVDEASDDAPRDTVIRFDPASGQQVSPGDEVQIIVSTGPSEVTVPDVTDMTQQEAKAELEKFNLKGGDVSTENSARVEYNHVTRTEPQSKELVSAGSTVNLFVSTGKTTVPNVKGKTQKDAEAALQQAGLTFGTAKTEVSDQPAGTVLRQTPKANAEASQGEQVTLTIAREAVTVTVRQVEGETQEAAVAILRDEQGLIPEIAREFSETVPSGMVTRTDPGPGVSATEGSTIYVFVSNGPSPPPTDPVVTPPPDPIQTQTGEPMENY